MVVLQWGSQMPLFPFWSPFLVITHGCHDAEFQGPLQNIFCLFILSTWSYAFLLTNVSLRDF
jgi:hypothetical protein